MSDSGGLGILVHGLHIASSAFPLNYLSIKHQIMHTQNTTAFRSSGKCSSPCFLCSASGNSLAQLDFRQVQTDATKLISRLSMIHEFRVSMATVNTPNFLTKQVFGKHYKQIVDKY